MPGRLLSEPSLGEQQQELQLMRRWESWLSSVSAVREGAVLLIPFGRSGSGIKQGNTLSVLLNDISVPGHGFPL